jgi:leucyl-tRNA synthetase
MACQQRWPGWDPQFLAETDVEIVIQVNGKLRDKVTVRRDLENEELKRVVLASVKVKEAASDRPVRKVIIVPNKLVNVVLE